MITFTIGGKTVKENALSERISHVAYVKDFRLEQLDKKSYRIIILPESDRDIRCLKGAVLDALVDIYGNKGRFDIDITTEDDELLPKVNDDCDKIRNLMPPQF